MQMHNKEKLLLKRFCLYFSGLITLLIVAYTNDVVTHVIAFWSMAIIAMAIVEFDVMHPYVWFSAFFGLYSTGYAIMDIYGLGIYGYSTHNILLQLVALLTFLIIVGPKRVNIKCYPLRQIKLDKTRSRYIILLFCFLVVICSLILNLRGYTSKVYMKEANDIFYRGGVHLVRFLTMFLLIHLCYIYECKKDNEKSITILTGIVLLLFSLFTGERDVIFRFAFIFMLLLFTFQKVKRRHIFLFIPIGVVFMIGSVYLKYYFTSGVLNKDFIEEGNVLTQFLSTDFSAAGRNLQYLLINSWTEASQGWQLLFTEIITPLFPSGFFLNPDNWFNTQVHSGNYTGYAFTLVGTGYIIDGYFGVIAIFVIIGMLARYLYLRSLKDLYNMAFYLFMISTIIFSFRQSLSTVFSGMIKVGFVSIILSRLLVPHVIRNVKTEN